MKWHLLFVITYIEAHPRPTIAIIASTKSWPQCIIMVCTQTLKQFAPPTIANGVCSGLILILYSGLSCSMTLHRYIPSLRASWKLPSGNASPTTASSHLRASVSLTGSFLESICKPKHAQVAVAIDSVLHAVSECLPCPAVLQSYHSPWDGLPLWTNCANGEMLKKPLNHCENCEASAGFYCAYASGARPARMRSAAATHTT